MPGSRGLTHGKGCSPDKPVPYEHDGADAAALVTAAPGIDVPMEGNVFQSFVYYWPFYTTTNKTLDDAPYNDRGRWFRMNHDWYVKGAPYRSLEKIDGTPNPFFARWLGHPSYDAYWQGMIPYGKDFARTTSRC
jgi:hypothetical protein